MTSAAGQDPSGHDEWTTRTSKHRITVRRSLETTPSKLFSLRPSPTTPHDCDTPAPAWPPQQVRRQQMSSPGSDTRRPARRLGDLPHQDRAKPELGIQRPARLVKARTPPRFTIHAPSSPPTRQPRSPGCFTVDGPSWRTLRRIDPRLIRDDARTHADGRAPRLAGLQHERSSAGARSGLLG